MEWHHARERRLGNADTWVAYAQEIEEHFADRAETANAHKELKKLTYEGDIQGYLVSLEALNQYTNMTGEGLKETVD